MAKHVARRAVSCVAGLVVIGGLLYAYGSAGVLSPMADLATTALRQEAPCPGPPEAAAARPAGGPRSPAPGLAPASAADPQELYGCQEQVRRARAESCALFRAADPRPRVLVTGGAGFIGGHLVKGLQQQGITSIKVADNLWRGRLSNLCDHTCKCVIDMAADFCLVDLTDSRATSVLFENVDVVYHLADVIAGIGFVFQNEHWLFQQNVLINANVLQGALRAETVQDYIYVGSACSFPLELQSSYEPVALREDQTYPAHPESAYGWSKLMGEYEAGLVLKMEAARRHGLNVGVLRFHNVYGPHSQYADKHGSQALPALIRKAIYAPKVEQFEVWGSSRQYRDFVYIDDIVAALLKVRPAGMNQGAIQIGTGEATTLHKAALVIKDLTGKCLGKEIDMLSNSSRLEGDSGRVAVTDRAGKLMQWKASVFIEEGLARFYRWVLVDLQHRGRIESWMFGTSANLTTACACLEATAAAARRSEVEAAVAQVWDGMSVWKQQPSSLVEQLGGSFSCNHDQPVAQAGEPAVGTLVVVICSTRGHHLTWRAFHDNLLEPLQADLALAVSTDTLPMWEGNSFRTSAKYIWAVSEPPDNDYQYWFDEIAQQCFHRSFTKEDAHTIGKQIHGHWLGLIKATEHRTASSILIFFRWIVLQHLEKAQLLSKYSHLIITRSDYLFIAPHPPVWQLQPGELMVPNGEGYGGVTDRHTVLHMADAPKILRLAETLVFDTGGKVSKWWLKELGHVGANGMNLETILMTWYRNFNNMKIRSIGQVMFIVYDSEDKSSQRAGEAYLSDIDPWVPTRVHAKYYTEYNGARVNAAQPMLYTKITDAMFQEMTRNMTRAKQALEKQRKEADKAKAVSRSDDTKRRTRSQKISLRPSPAPAASPAPPLPEAPPPPMDSAPAFTTGSSPSAPKARQCFALPPGDKIMKDTAFTPDISQALPESVESGQQDAAARAREGFARSAKVCECAVRPFEMCPHGVGSSLSSMLKPFTQAVIDGVPFAAEAPRHLSAEAVGLRPLVEDCALAAPGRPGPKCKKQVNPSCHAWHWKAVDKHLRVPDEYKERGLFWWTAQQFAWLLRPGERLAAQVASLKAALQWEAHRPILGMHVRHGDSCMQGEGSRTGRKCESLAVYMRGARQMQQYGFRSVYLATDDAAVLEEARRDYPDITWLIGQPTSSQSRNANGGSNHRFEQMAFESGEKNMDLVREFQEVLSDIFMLADTDGFVGKFTSNMDRIAYALNYGQRGCAAPFVSLDAYWCSDYGLETGRTVQGAKFAC